MPKIKPRGKSAHLIKRRKDRMLADRLVLKIAQRGGEMTPEQWKEVCHEAINEVYERPVGPEVSLDIVKRKLNTNVNIRQAIGAVYEDVGGYSIMDAVRKHVDHIEGNITKEVVTKTGEVIEAKIPPSWAALKTFLDMTLPQPAKHVKLDVGLPQGRSMLSDVPPIAARALGPATVSEAIEDAQTVEFEEEPAVANG